MSTATPGRVICPRCSSNNFDTQAACWKCGSPLTAGAGAASSGAVLRPGPAQPPPSAQPSAAAAVPYRAPGVAGQGVAIDPSVAIWAAAFLAIFFPYIAICAGLVFLMLDDRRKAEIGRITLILGIVFTIIHTIVTGYLIGAAVNEMRQAVPGLLGQAASARRAAQGEPQKLTDPVAPLPSFPTN